MVTRTRNKNFEPICKFLVVFKLPEVKISRPYSPCALTRPTAKKIFVPIKIDFYDRKNKLFKTLSNQKVKKIKGMYLVTKSIMNNHETKGQTTITSSDIRVGISVSNADVGLRGLQQ